MPLLHWDFMNNRVRLESSRDRGRSGQPTIRSLQDKRREAAFLELGWELNLSWDGNSVQFLFVGSLKPTDHRPLRRSHLSWELTQCGENS